jgi:hypothetical protein
MVTSFTWLISTVYFNHFEINPKYSKMKHEVPFMEREMQLDLEPRVNFAARPRGE